MEIDVRVAGADAVGNLEQPNTPSTTGITILEMTQ